MTDYSNFTAADFIKDPYFRSWVLDNDLAAGRFFADWLAKHSHKKDEVEDAQALLYAMREKMEEPSDREISGRVEATLQMIREGRGEARMEEMLVRPWYHRYAAIAAMVCVALGLGWLGTKYLRGELGEQQAAKPRYYSAETGIVKFNNTATPILIMLEDSSTVTLQPQSELEYPKVFAAGKREVHLTGEAFFDITPNPNRPFLVLTEELVTQVLGTSFTVRSFEKDRNASVSVKTGRVSVYSKKEEASSKEKLSKEIAGVVLKPNQQVLFDKEESRLVKVIVNAPQRIADVPSVALVFDEIPVKNVFKTLEKEYGIEIIFNEETLAACLLTANLSELPMYEQLDLICKIIKARYELIDGQVVIHSEGCK